MSPQTVHQGRGICIGDGDGMFRSASPILLVLAAIPARAQEPPMLDQLAGIIDRGTLNVAVDLKPGTAAITPQWRVVTEGAPRAMVTVDADEGRVQCLDIDVRGGTLLLAGRGLRPAVALQGLRFEDGMGIVEARVRGRGVWRPVVALFRALSRRALRNLDVPTDIATILHGDLVTSKSNSSTTSTEFLKLVRDVRVSKSEFQAFDGYPLAFDPLVDFRTQSLHAAIDKATFTPPASFTADGRIDGSIEDGSAAFVGNHCRFSHGELRRGTFHVANDKTMFTAGELAIDLTSGTFRWPGGPSVGVDAPSHFEVRNLRVRPDGSYSGIVDAALTGKVGTIDRAGVSIAANDVQFHTQGARIVDGKATGDVSLQFRYALSHTLIVHYPVEELRDRGVPLLLNGTFAAQLHFVNAGSGDSGEVTGTYRFTIPWAPVQQAAFEVLRARWQQDIAPAVHKVDFAIDPRRFGPCGPDCFQLDLQIKAEKPNVFQQICNSEGKADVVIDRPARSLLLRNVRVEPRCEGVLGALVNFLAPFLTKSYSDVSLLQMPKDLPFSIESVGTTSDSIFIGGNVEWALKAATPASTPTSSDRRR